MCCTYLQLPHLSWPCCPSQTHRGTASGLRRGGVYRIAWATAAINRLSWRRGCGLRYRAASGGVLRLGCHGVPWAHLKPQTGLSRVRFLVLAIPGTSGSLSQASRGEVLDLQEKVGGSGGWDCSTKDGATTRVIHGTGHGAKNGPVQGSCCLGGSGEIIDSFSVHQAFHRWVAARNVGATFVRPLRINSLHQDLPGRPGMNLTCAVIGKRNFGQYCSLIPHFRRCLREWREPARVALRRADKLIMSYSFAIPVIVSQ